MTTATAPQTIIIDGIEYQLVPMTEPAEAAPDLDPVTYTPERVSVAGFVEWLNTEADIPEGYEFGADRPGRKYTRIWHTWRGTGRAVHCFVDNVTADVFKPAGWKSPAPGPRASLDRFDELKARFDWAGSYLYR